VTTLSYDGDTGNLLTAIADSGTSPHLNATTTIAYNGLGLPVSVRNPVNIVTAFEYDTRGNRTAIVADAANLRRRTSLAYDSVGNAISMTDPRGGVTTNGWDAGRQLVTTTSPATLAAPSGLVTTNTYDANGQVLQSRQSANATVLTTASATYTLSGKTATATDARGNITRYAYDPLDRLVSVTDPMSRRTQFTYTVLSQPYRTYAPAIQAAPLLEQAWTDDGLGASLKDANGNSTGFAYDRFDRLVTTTYPGGSTETATWDAASNMLTRTTRAGATLRYGYDTLNRLVTKTAAATPVACSAATSATPTVTYRYDLASRMTGVCDNGAVVAAITPPPSAIVYSTAYSYNALGQPTGVTFDPVPTPTLPSTASTTSFDFGYNTANQRVSFAASDNAWIDYATGPDMLTTYMVNNLNQYTFVGTVGFVTPTYDGNGNLTSDGTFTFGYDTENRLITASKTGTSATYASDAQGRRKAKSVTTGATNTTTVFVTDADNREVLEYDAATASILRWYAHGLGPNDVLAEADVGAGKRVTPMPDLLGSIIATMDASSGILTRYGYKPYGSSTAAPSQFAYTGQRNDVESGLYYYRAREYSPTWGRFLQPDPIGYSGGLLLYGYAGNDPINLLDPFGLSAEQSSSWLGSTTSWLADRAAFCQENCFVTSYFTSSTRGLRPGMAALLNVCGAACDPGFYASIAPALGPLSIAPSEMMAMSLTGLRAGLGLGRAGEAGLGLRAAENVAGSGAKLRGLADNVEGFLGPNYTKFSNSAGDLRYRSADGTKQIRFDLKDFHGDPKGPHINLETFEPRNLYPGDRAMVPVSNEHIYPKGP
jgi:RHS repeat-associated protein